MLKKIIFSLTMGVIATLYFAQNDQWVHDAVARKLKETLQPAWNCQLDFQVDSVNIFVPSVTLKNVQARPNDVAQNGWHWNAEHLTLNTSWIAFALSSMVGLHIQVDTAQAHTTAQGDYIPLIHDHVERMINGASVEIPIYIKSLSFVTSTIHAKHVESQTDLFFQWSSKSQSIDGIFKTAAFIHDGNVNIAQNTWCDRLQGDLDLNFVYTVLGLKAECIVACTANLHITKANTLPCSITGSWHTNHGDFSIEAADQSFIIKPLKIVHSSKGFTIDTQAIAPLDKALRLFCVEKFHEINGECQLSVHSELGGEHQKIEGTCTLNNITFGDFLLSDSAQLSFNYLPDKLNGLLSFNNKSLGSAQGPWQWDIGKSAGELMVHNKDAISLPGLSKWTIDAHKFSLNAKIDANNEIEATYNVLAHNQLTYDKIQSQGTWHWHDATLHGKGHINRSLYEGVFVFDPSLIIKKLTYKNSHGATLLEIHESNNEKDQFQGTINIGLLRSLSKQILHYDIQGEGHIGLRGSIKDTQLQLDVQLNDGLIRLAQTYNFINACAVKLVCDLGRKNLTLNDLRIQLHRGSISSARMIMQWDDAYNVQYAYAPFVFESCLFNMKKDFFALFSGTLAISKKYNQLAHAKGSFVIERSYVKENLYSAAFQKNIAGLTYLMVDVDKQDMSCDISIETKEPIRVDTAFLEANAKVALHIANTVREPKVSGVIELISGSLAFPYKPLLITKGSIYFMPDQLFDPLIELVAKNKIKNYTVGLEVTGSLLNHHISLESSPPLTDEQIIALLLVGSQEQSLNIMMPALLMQNLKSMLFDSEQSPLKLNNSFKSWLKPFKNINLIPSFSDQTGRGGLRGAIEIEMSDRWRAMAQKNFSLSEDTRFEVEYSLSDDITLRGIRNERKDVAAEVEMRWKFGR